MVALIEDYIRKMGLAVSVERIRVVSDEDVQVHRFIGSPSVRINGLDIEPSARSVTQYGFT